MDKEGEKNPEKDFPEKFKDFLEKGFLENYIFKMSGETHPTLEHKGGGVLSYLPYFHIWFIKYVKCNLNSVNLLSSVHFFDLIFRLCFKIYWCKVQSIWSCFRKILDFNLDITFIIIANVNVNIRCLWILIS